MDDRLQAARDVFGEAPGFREGDLRDYELVANTLKEETPDAIVHLGEMPSAPYSMADVHRAYFTQENNVLGTLNLLFAMRDYCPDAHLIKLGTMGEYGTPNIDIPEGAFEIEYNGRKDWLPFPRQPGSFYHLSKVHDTFNIMFACKIWGLRSTDVMQGVVYGTRTDETKAAPELSTRFDIDGVFGTAINRFCAQAVLGVPLTPYGQGGQKRGFIALRDSLECMVITLNNSPSKGEYRTFNQFDQVYDVGGLAQLVASLARDNGLRASVSFIENPRIEAENHYYNPANSALKKLGFVPKFDIKEETEIMLRDLLRHRDRISKLAHVLNPKIQWDPRQGSESSQVLMQP
jgi:nucleoside-diphosphate-sugar epimerase